MKHNSLFFNIRIINLLLVGILAGAMFEEYFFLKVILAELPKEQWTRLHARFGILHPYTIIPIATLSTLSLVFILIMERKINSGGKHLTWWAALLFLAIILITAVIMMPLNFTIVNWKANGIPDNWIDIRDKWTMYQGIRTLLSITGFLILIVAAHLSVNISKGDKHLA
jgi:uncharacterized membrane protein